MIEHNMKKKLLQQSPTKHCSKYPLKKEGRKKAVILAAGDA